MVRKDGLEVGFLSAAEHPVRGTLFPQPWVRHGAGWALMDRVTGGGWRIVRDREWVELDGIAAAWFARHGAVAAILRPDNDVYGVAAAAASLAHEVVVEDDADNTNGHQE